MIIHNGILCISIAPLAAAGILKPTVRKDGKVTYELWKKWAKRAKTLGYYYQPGGNGRESLIEYAAVPERYQRSIEERIGNPHKQGKLKAFTDYIERDKAAEDYYRDYRYGENDELSLPLRLIKTYTANAEVLNAIRTIYNNRLASRKKMGGSMRSFWQDVIDPVNQCKATIGHKLPGTHLRLKVVYEEYISGSYASLISGKLGNKNTEKITPEIEAWIVSEMASTRQSIEMVYLKYLQEAFKRSWRTDIEAAAFRHRVSQPRVQQLIDLARHGRKGLRKLHGHSFKLRKAKYANDIWVSDGTTLDLYFRRDDGTVGLASMYAVMDSMSCKMLGWATTPYMNKENNEVQLSAYRMALRNANALPYQLKYDNQKGHKTQVSQDFYKRLATVHFPSKPYRPSAKRIEFAFGKFQSLKLSEFPFWAGFGRTTWSDVNHAPNMDWINAHKDELPSYKELVQLFEIIIAEWNDLDFSGKGSPNKLYAENRNPEEQPLDVQDLMDLFWNIKGPVKYHAHGITLHHNNEQFLYEVYDHLGNVDYNFRRKYLHQGLFIKYDPDMEYTEIELYVKDAGTDLRHVATAKPKRDVSESVKYLNDDDRAWIEKQMKLEEQMMDTMEAELVSIGYDEHAKATRWRERLKQPAAVSHDDDDSDWRKKI
jgi:hypothetical protein